MEHILYECGICSCLHPWDFNGDCRDDSNRYGDAQEYAEEKGITPFDVIIRSMDDRLSEDSIETTIAVSLFKNKEKTGA